MLPLPELEREFAHALRDAQVPARHVRGRGLDPSRRIQVYRNNMLSSLTAALRTVYPVTERLVGEQFFAAAAQGYIQSNPSHSGNIQDYGGAFPAFLQGFAPAAALAYLPDVAALEWRRLETALGPPHTPMDLAALAAVPAELQPELHFRHQPTARAFCSPHPILSIWEFCQSAEPEGELDLDAPGECVLFARPRLDVVMRRVSLGEYAFLQGICHGVNFETAAQAALQAEPAFDVARNFAKLVQEEILTGFYL